jgi:hypothetical protein
MMHLLKHIYEGSLRNTCFLSMGSRDVPGVTRLHMHQGASRATHTKESTGGPKVTPLDLNILQGSVPDRVVISPMAVPQNLANETGIFSERRLVSS